VLPALGWAGPGLAGAGVLVAVFLLAMVPVAIAVAGFVRDRVAAFQLLMFLSVPVFVASGFTWPADQLPTHVRAVAALFPATPALRGLRILSMKTADLGAIAPELAWLALQLVAWTLLAAAVVRTPWARRRGATLTENASS
jgi:ABC-2 type transport system permease protein